MLRAGIVSLYDDSSSRAGYREQRRFMAPPERTLHSKVDFTKSKMRFAA